MVLMYKLPESPKFVLNEGKEEETLDILKTVYSINKRCPKDEFPVSNIFIFKVKCMLKLT